MSGKWNEFVKKLKTPMMRRGQYTLKYVQEYHELMGRPGDKLNIIHVAGTNAKGTVTFKLAKMLELSGYRTGLFLSPHLFSWRERVQLDSRLIDKEYCGEFIDKYQALRQRVGYDLSFFEFFTLLAYDYYSRSAVDVAVMEVGLGGRMDATNILDKSLLSIITSISLDHTDTLGDTIDAIAAEKCGIIKQGCPVVVGPAVPLHVVRQFTDNFRQSRASSTGFFEENKQLLSTARSVLSETSRFKIPEAVFEEVCAHHELPCRLERATPAALKGFPQIRSVYFDVGHNPDAIDKTLARYKQLIGGRPFAVVYGCKVKKDYLSCIEHLTRESAKVYLVQSSLDSAVVAAQEMLSKAPHNPKLTCLQAGRIDAAMADVLQGRDGLQDVLVIGSFTLMREARQPLGYTDATD